MKKTLIILGHPFWNDSVANRGILAELRALMPHAEVSNIAELYPSGRVDVAAEQAKLREAEVVVVQYPIFWYGAPSSLISYMEQVFTPGFAYDAGGVALEGKTLIASFTAGAPEVAFVKDADGRGMTPADLAASMAGTAGFCRMAWGGFVGSYAMTGASAAQCRDHAARLASLVEGCFASARNGR